MYHNLIPEEKKFLSLCASGILGNSAKKIARSLNPEKTNKLTFYRKLIKVNRMRGSLFDCYLISRGLCFLHSLASISPGLCNRFYESDFWDLKNPYLALWNFCSDASEKYVIMMRYLEKTGNEDTSNLIKTIAKYEWSEEFLLELLNRKNLDPEQIKESIQIFLED